jgi:hypothetical protein
MDPKLLVKSSKIIGSAPKMQFRKNQKNRPSSAVYLLVSQSVSRYWWHGWTPHPFAYICSQTVLLPRTLRSRSGSQLWGIEGAPRRQGGSIERGSESAQNSPITEPNPTDLRVQRRHTKREGKVERDTARVFYMRLSPVRLKIQFNSSWKMFCD